MSCRGHPITEPLPLEVPPNRENPSLVDDALQMAIAGRANPAEPLVAHTDNGSQYTAWGYTLRLADAGIVPSRGRTGTALDNAMAESVIATIKTELTKKHVWRTRLDLELALLT